MEEPRYAFLTVPSLNTYEYKVPKKWTQTTASEIVSSLKQFEEFSTNLEEKVDTLLKAQETEFVKSYKIHMDKVK